jgi:hypothetical protein
MRAGTIVPAQYRGGGHAAIAIRDAGRTGGPLTAKAYLSASYQWLTARPTLSDRERVDVERA